MIRKYKKGDAKKVNVQDEQILEAMDGAVCFDKITAFSLIDKKGKVLAVFGFRVIGNKGEGFALLGKKIGNKMILLFRFVDRLIKLETKRRGINKVFITVKKNFDKAFRLAHLWGFKEVKKLPHFFYDEDYVLMVRKVGNYGV